jgi:hypothetical protein
MAVKADDVERLKELGRENGRLRKMAADQLLDLEFLNELSKRSW